MKVALHSLLTARHLYRLSSLVGDLSSVCQRQVVIIGFTPCYAMKGLESSQVGSRINFILGLGIKEFCLLVVRENLEPRLSCCSSSVYALARIRFFLLAILLFGSLLLVMMT